MELGWHNDLRYLSSENAAVGLRPILVVKAGDVVTGTRVFTGDVNNDGAVNIADAIFLLGILFGGSGDVPACGKAADSNDDNATQCTP